MAANPKDPPRHPYTLEEYFAIQRTGQSRYEYWEGDIVCMSGGSRHHGRISGNTYFALRRSLSGTGCEVFTSDFPIKTPLLPPYRYPDTSVACDRAVFEEIQGIDTLTNPTLVIEVLSPGTERRDRKEKRAAYQAIPSLMEYLLIAQDAPHITHFRREANGWARSDYGDLAAVLALPSLRCELALGDVYVGIEFD